MEKVKQGLLVLLLIVSLTGWIGSAVGANKHKQLADTWLDGYEHLLSEVDVERNRNQSLSGAIQSLETDNDDLKATIANLEARPETIKYITRTETVITPSEPVLITLDLPDEYLFTLGPDIVVARFTQEDGGYRFDTYELGFRNMIVIAEQKTAASLSIQSSYDPDRWEEIPVDVKVSEIYQQPLIEPHIGVGITASTAPSPLVGSFFVTTIHPTSDIDVLGVRIGTDTKLARFGIDAVGYNIGKPLPVLTDTWLYAGGSIDTAGHLSADITIGSKF